MINPMELMNNDSYYADKNFMSVSRYKKLKKCEVDGLKDFDNENLSDALLMGQYIDRYIEGTLDEFKLEHPEMISTRGKTKGQLKAVFKQADEICNFIDNDKLISQFLSGDKQTVMTGKINDVPFKIKMDSYAKGIAISDLKVMRTITNDKGEYYDFITKWGYDIQLACYQEIVFQNTGEKLPCYIVAVTKETPINSAVIQIPQEILDTVLYNVTEDIQHFYDVLTHEIEPTPCGKCKTCISKRDTPLITMSDLMNE